MQHLHSAATKFRFGKENKAHYKLYALIPDIICKKYDMNGLVWYT